MYADLGHREKCVNIWIRFFRISDVDVPRVSDDLVFGLSETLSLLD